MRVSRAICRLGPARFVKPPPTDQAVIGSRPRDIMIANIHNGIPFFDLIETDGVVVKSGQVRGAAARVYELAQDSPIGRIVVAAQGSDEIIRSAGQGDISAGRTRDLTGKVIRVVPV